jgi:hypothetical protein
MYHVCWVWLDGLLYSTVCSMTWSLMVIWYTVGILLCVESSLSQFLHCNYWHSHILWNYRFWGSIINYVNSPWESRWIFHMGFVRTNQLLLKVFHCFVSCLDCIVCVKYTWEWIMLHKIVLQSLLDCVGHTRDIRNVLYNSGTELWEKRNWVFLYWYQLPLNSVEITP